MKPVYVNAYVILALYEGTEHVLREYDKRYKGYKAKRV